MPNEIDIRDFTIIVYSKSRSQNYAARQKPILQELLAPTNHVCTKLTLILHGLIRYDWTWVLFFVQNTYILHLPESLSARAPTGYTNKVHHHTYIYNLTLSIVVIYSHFLPFLVQLFHQLQGFSRYSFHLLSL